MRTLFFKIFLSFWLSHLLVVMLLFSVLKAALESRDAADPRGAAPLPSQALEGAARLSAAAFESGGTKTLAAQLNRIRDKTGLSSVLLDSSGRSLARSTGNAVPARGLDLARLAARSGQAEFAPVGPDIVGARPVRSGGRLYVLVAQSSAGGGTLLGGRRLRFESARLLAVLLGALVVAWGLARYLTAPVVKLRSTAQQLASGDLSARVGPQMGSRRDELAELGRDFDLMAERIEGLMMSERRRAESQHRLLADISHELRSPLARIAFALELAHGDDGQTPKYLERIERESGRLNELIGQLLTLARLESGGEISRGVSIDLARLVKDVAEDADFEARRRDCRVHTVQLDECRLQGAPDLLRSAIENVVRNALRYTREGSTVQVSLQHASAQLLSPQAPAEAVIRVRDFGPGVPESSLSEMFRPFYRVEDARDRQSGGTGLGLSITQRAVRLHGGSVRACNAPDGGLEIELRLPLVPAASAAASVEKPDESRLAARP